MSYSQCVYIKFHAVCRGEYIKHVQIELASRASNSVTFMANFVA